jgi:succinate dehydrogenase / fumarate reductase cytochrome b subunit
MRRLFSLYDSTVGKKITMAASGIVLVGFVVVHMIGNLKVYQGRDAFNHYAEGLRVFGAPFFAQGQLLWIARLILLAAVGVHILAAIQLTLRSRAARAHRYSRFDALVFSQASRTMFWGGLILAGFVVYHLLHFTLGNAHPDFIPGDAYHNLVVGFSMWPVSLAYIAAMIPLGLHLYHGTWSVFQTLGANNPRYNRYRRPLAGGLALAVVLGNISFPLAVLAGWIA